MWERKGNIYIFSYFGMFSDYIRDFEVFFFCLLGVWVLRKCGKVKRNWLFFFWSLICLVLRNWKQPKTDRTEPIEVHSVRCRCSSLSVRCRCQIWETENFGSVEKSHFKPTEPNRLHPLLVV